EKRSAHSYRRQAQDELAERLFFNLLDGLACDLEWLGAGARQFTKSIFILSYSEIKTPPVKDEVHF
ncbi:hypothetical protein, partial [Neobacillus cucumis]|uniref:hypothetical protein n=1 Tax=Neobacillus cucumis TaxID=1740721 RepID=UPI002E206888|nr:hypothetical protein [Neobacillus cucumis]